MRLGETYAGAFEVRNSLGVLATADTTQVLITKPDGTPYTPAPTAAETGGTGNYTWSWTPTVDLGRYTIVVRITLGGKTRDLGPDAVNVDDNSTAAPLVGLAEMKSHLNIDTDDTSDDEELRRAILSASDEVERRTRMWHRATVVERVPAFGAVFLSSLPVVSVTSVVQGSTTFDPTTYRVDAIGALIPAANTTWSPWRTGWYYDDLVVTYVAGETIVPGPVREAVILTVADFWESQRGAAGLPFDEAAGATAAPTPGPEGALPWEAERKLTPWLREVAIA